MNPKILFALKIAAVVLIGMCVVVLLGANKIASSIVLIVTAIVILLPLGKYEWLKWYRVAFVVVAFTFVLWNISTTEYPGKRYKNDIKFFNKVLFIYDSFFKNVFDAKINR